MSAPALVAVRPPGGRSIARRLLACAAAVAASALAMTLCVRPIGNFDIGYHLAYGEHVLDGEGIVQTNEFIYTRLRSDILSHGENLGPGCRFDAATGTYHFVNANWLSQVVMALAWRAGGFTALCLLQAGALAAIFAILVGMMRRAGVGWEWVAPGVILVALTGYERFNLRPEAFGYLMLAGQVCLLTAERFTRRHALGVTALQVLAANVHSYFLLGIAVTGAVFADALARWLWARSVVRAEWQAPAARARLLAAALGGTILGTLVNPFFLRGAIMPIQTLLYLRKYHVVGQVPEGATVHPWALIGEITSPFFRGLAGARATKAYYVMMALTALAFAAALARRRWGWALLLGGMAAMSLQMRRNFAPAAMVAVPVALLALKDGWTRLATSPRGQRAAGIASLVSAAVALVLGTWWTVSVATNRFYFSERRLWRFGFGTSRMALPLEAVEFINRHQPAGNVFCDYDTSSNVMYFTRPRRQVPALTNTWAYPPYVMQWVVQATAGQRDFAPIADEYDVGTVVLRYSPVTPPLMRTLAVSPDWAVAQVSTQHVVFVRRTGPTADLARRVGLDERTFDTGAFIERVRRDDPVQAHALHNAAVMLRSLGWLDPAARVWRVCVEEVRPDYYDAMAAWAGCLATRGTRKLLTMQTLQEQGQFEQAAQARQSALQDWRQAEDLLVRALEIRPDYKDARDDLSLLRKQKEDFARGIIAVPRER